MPCSASSCLCVFVVKLKAKPLPTTLEPSPPETRDERLNLALRRVVLLRETGPKSAAWQRARVVTLWRLHRLLEAERQPTNDPRPKASPQ